MARNNKRNQHLKNITKSVKRLQSIKIHHKGSIYQRLSKRNGYSVNVLEDELINSDFIEHFHIEKLLNLLRERNWDHCNERLFGMIVFSILKLSGLKRKIITDIMKGLDIISYYTAELYVHRLLNNEMDVLTDDNRGKYHRQSVFEYFPDLKDHIFKF